MDADGDNVVSGAEVEQHVHEMEAKVAELEQAKTALEQSQLNAQSLIASLKAELDTASALETALEAKVAELEAKLAAKITELEKLLVNDSVLVEKMDADGDNVVSGAEVEQHVHEMEAKVAELELSLDSCNSNNSELQQQVADLELQLEKGRATLSNLSEQHEESSADLAANVQTFEAKVAELEAQLAAKCAELEKLLVKDSVLVQKMDADGDNVVSGAEVEQHVHELEAKVAELEALVVATESVSSGHADASGALEGKVAELEAKLAAKIAELEKLLLKDTVAQSLIASLKAEVEKLQVTNSRVVTAMDANGDGAVDGSEVVKHFNQMEVTHAEDAVRIAELEGGLEMTKAADQVTIADLQVKMAQQKCDFGEAEAADAAKIDSLQRLVDELQARIVKLRGGLFGLL